MSITAPDLTKAPPRSGRVMLGRYPWLARLADKVRALQAGTHSDYVAYCDVSRPFLELAGITIETFDELIARGSSDADLVRYFDVHCTDEQRAAMTRLVLVEKKANLDRQDAEEGHVP